LLAIGFFGPTPIASSSFRSGEDGDDNEEFSAAEVEAKLFQSPIITEQ
jgi:hypothetical protein